MAIVLRMARPRSVPDEVVHNTVLSLLRAGGPKAVTFGAVAAGAGLAASSLAQRHGTVTGMIRDARVAEWARLTAATQEAAALSPISPKGAAALLKRLGDAMRLPDPDPSGDTTLAELATAWRSGLEAELALRLGGGAKGRDAAAILFAAWVGQLTWQAAGGRGFKLRQAVKRLTG